MRYAIQRCCCCIKKLNCYNIEIILNIPLAEFEEFKSHLRSVRTPSGRKTDLKQAPVRGLGTPNGGIVVLDKTAGETISIVPKNAARFCKEWQKETPYRLTRYGVLWTRRESNPRPFGCEPNALPAISLLCTPYALREKENQRIFVHMKCSAMQTTFRWNKYSIQAVDFQDKAIWDVI